MFGTLVRGLVLLFGCVNGGKPPLSRLASPPFPPAMICVSCRIAALPGLSKGGMMLAQMWSAGLRAGRGEKDKGETAKLEGR